jgi:phosphoglycolate phosphatase
MISTIIWDWNGTLLNDLESNIEIVNIILSRRNLKPLTIDTYKQLFCFPVSKFYDKIGIDVEKETLAGISVEYVELYYERFSKNRLNDGVVLILENMKNRNIKNYILSATNHKDLEKQVEEMNIKHYFEKIVGSNNIEGKSKIEKASKLVRNEFINADETLIIGDTLHDLEVAKAINSRCVLFAHGHQQLSNNGDYILINKMSDIFRLL